MHLFNSIDEAQLWLLSELFTNGEFIYTRGSNTLEICHVNFCISNPINRKTHNPIRKWKLPLAVGEFSWHYSGSNDLDFISYYAREWRKFSEDDMYIKNSCYGYRIFRTNNSNLSQWRNIVSLLREDIHSRRAVLSLIDPTVRIDCHARDIACVNTVQFLVRKGRVDAIVNMRSNDLIWGLPYDIFIFTMLQEILSLELNLAIGNYYHNVGSMHIYERHYSLAKSMLNYRIENVINEPKMESLEGLNIFIEYEELIRKGRVNRQDLYKLDVDPYWMNLLNCLVDYKTQAVKFLEVK